MAKSHTASRTIAELREFAGFTAQEQFFIERSLEVRRDGWRAPGEPGACAASSFRRSQREAYRELDGLRGGWCAGQPLAALDGFFAALVRVTAQDLARGALASFAAYRFLYERLLGAAVRPYLPASFCAAATLPQIEPARRKLLLASLPEIVVSTPGWSDREPVFVPRRVLDEEPECGQ